MSDSRNNFENAPDTGIFGKNFARIWNYIEVYLFRFLIVGICIVLILFPITIIINTVCALTISVTSWLWTPICLILR